MDNVINSQGNSLLGQTGQQGSGGEGISYLKPTPMSQVVEETVVQNQQASSNVSGMTTTVDNPNPLAQMRGTMPHLTGQQLGVTMQAHQISTAPTSVHLLNPQVSGDLAATTTGLLLSSTSTIEGVAHQSATNPSQFTTSTISVIPLPAVMNQDQYIATGGGNASVPTPTVQPSAETVKITSDDLQQGNGRDGWIRGTLVALVIVVVVLIFLGIGGGVLAMTGKIEIPEVVRKEVLGVWMTLPLVPVPPELVLAQAAVTMQEVEQLDMDLSLAVTSDSLSSMFGSSDIDVVVKGPVNFENDKKPKAALNISTNNQLNADFIVDGDMYFRINQIPQTILGVVMGVSDENSDTIKGFLNRWVHYSKTEVESNARNTMKQESIAKDPSETLSEKMNILLKKEIAPLLESESVEYGGERMSQISVILQGQVINDTMSALATETTTTRRMIDSEDILPSDYIKNVKLKMLVDKAFLLRKIELYLLVDNSGLVDKWSDDKIGSTVPLTKETVELAIVGEMSNFGKASPIMTPTDYVELEDFIAEVMELVRGDYAAQMQAAEQSADYQSEEMQKWTGPGTSVENGESLPDQAAWGTQVLGIWTEERF